VLVWPTLSKPRLAPLCSVHQVQKIPRECMSTLEAVGFHSFKVSQYPFQPDPNPSTFALAPVKYCTSYGVWCKGWPLRNADGKAAVVQVA
jgi:hypothetical protein